MSTAARCLTAWGPRPTPIRQLHPPKAAASPTDAASRTPFTHASRRVCLQGLSSPLFRVTRYHISISRIDIGSYLVTLLLVPAELKYL